jgi:hypothetical protein
LINPWKKIGGFLIDKPFFESIDVHNTPPFGFEEDINRAM